MFCSRCGREVESGARYCKYCGQELGESEYSAPLSTDIPADVVSDSGAVNDTATPLDAVATSNTAPTDATESTSLDEPTDDIGRKVSRRRKKKRMREIEDARSLDNYTIRDDMVESASVLPTDRISLQTKGSLKGLKTKEIIYITIAVLVMILSAVVIAYIRANNIANEDSMRWLMIVGYLLFFVIFFAMAAGVDRIYNLLTLGELGVRKITVKKYGFGLTPLMLRDGKVYAIEVVGECEFCETEPKGTYHIEWQSDELIAVCNYDRKHLYKIDKEALIGAETDEVRVGEDR